MPDLDTAAVAQYTGDRLDAADDETSRLLDAALATARRWCGWHVTPEQDDTVTLDGPGGRLLILPTLKLVTLTSVVEDGVTLDVADLYVSGRGMLRKRSRGCWSDKFGGITVEMTHGFAEAPDFDGAVLSLVDRESYAPAGGRLRAVGPFQYDLEPIGAASAFTAAEQAKLAQYRLERSA